MGEARTSTAGGDHFSEGTFGGDGDAAVVVRFLGSVSDAFISELAADFIDHGHRGDSDGLHGHSGEPVGEHGADEDSWEDTVI